MRAAEKSRGRPSWSLHPDSPLSLFPDPPSAHTSTFLSSAPGSLSHTGAKSSPPSPPHPALWDSLWKPQSSTITSDTHSLICLFHQERVTGIFQHQMLCWLSSSVPSKPSQICLCVQPHGLLMRGIMGIPAFHSFSGALWVVVSLREIRRMRRVGWEK